MAVASPSPVGRMARSSRRDARPRGNGARRAPEAAKPLAPETPSSAPGGRARARARTARSRLVGLRRRVERRVPALEREKRPARPRADPRTTAALARAARPPCGEVRPRAGCSAVSRCQTSALRCDLVRLGVRKHRSVASAVSSPVSSRASPKGRLATRPPTQPAHAPNARSIESSAEPTSDTGSPPSVPHGPKPLAGRARRPERVPLSFADPLWDKPVAFPSRAPAPGTPRAGGDRLAVSEPSRSGPSPPAGPTAATPGGARREWLRCPLRSPEPVRGSHARHRDDRAIYATGLGGARPSAPAVPEPGPRRALRRPGRLIPKTGISRRRAG